ncbi:MAG TPA: hypothetical protein VN883_03060 [Myxococcales bacterium]|nr:hypothetical protein [Myxococcales bacterium]
MTLLALLFAAAECAGLVPALPAPAKLPAQDACSSFVIDGTSSMASACGATEMYRTVDGTALGTSNLGVSFLAPRARGFWASRSDYSSKLSFVSVDRDGTVLGTLDVPLTPGGFERHTLVPDPRGGALILDVVTPSASMPAANPPWQLAMRRVTDAMSVVEGPRILAAGSTDPLFEFDAGISTDGAFLLTADGWQFPPLRNNQVAARWFDSGGAPITDWFAALDQATFGWPMLLLGDGSIVVDSRYRRARLARGIGPAPSWLPADLQTVTVLPDRIAIARWSASPCATTLEIHAPSGALCGSFIFPLTTQAGVCSQGVLSVAREGTLTLREFLQPPPPVLVWPRLLAPP